MKISIIVIVNKKSAFAKRTARQSSSWYSERSIYSTILEVISLRTCIQELFWSILQHCEIGIFLQFGYYLRREWSDFHQNFITHVMMYPWTRKSH